MSGLIQIEQVRRTRVLRLNDPDARNALTPALLAELRAAVEEAEEDPEARAVVITGDGERFCAGGDIGVMDQGVSGGYRYVREVIGLFRRVEHMSTPVIAAVDGYALGGGMELALSCDLILAAETASFGLPESKLGAVPGYAIVRLPELIGRPRAKELMWSGRRIPAAEALEYGIVLAVHPPAELLDAALELGDRVAAMPRITAEVIKLAANGSIADRTLAETTVSAALFWGTDELAEGLAAFRERRAPQFER